MVCFFGKYGRIATKKKLCGVPPHAPAGGDPLVGELGAKP